MLEKSFFLSKTIPLGKERWIITKIIDMSLSDYEIARKRVADKKKFHKHLATYIIFSCFWDFCTILILITGV